MLFSIKYTQDREQSTTEASGWQQDLACSAANEFTPCYLYPNVCLSEIIPPPILDFRGPAGLEVQMLTPTYEDPAEAEEVRGWTTKAEEGPGALLLPGLLTFPGRSSLHFYTVLPFLADIRYNALQMVWGE